MRLNTIKLAGFKSFVDPTTFNLESNLTAVLGPNGCGKSNIVDAVRWVTGESSAKQLRGESLTDVIFNGTKNRKPVGQASIELTFDNSDASIGGEFAKFSEISLRREMNREGTSQYYLNNTRCRRRDIIDVLLGTGLGPRSYAIIEQGMISQLIEAKPDEMRMHLEEAAGISKYKERRRETENRIRHTRENLDRLNDVREEIDKQLAHLKRQASAAERYKVYKKEERLVKAQLQALHIQQLNDQLKTQTQAITEQEIKLEQKLTEHQHIDTEIEKQRDHQTQLRDVFNEVQERFYRIGGSIGRIEQQIQHKQDRIAQLEEDLAQTQANMAESEEHLSNDRAQVKTLTTELESITPETEQAQKISVSLQEERQQAEDHYHNWQENWDAINTRVSSATQRAEVEQTRIQHLEQRIGNLTKRIGQLQAKQENDDSNFMPNELEGLHKNCAEFQNKLSAAQTALATLQAQIDNQRKLIVESKTTIKQKRDEFQNLQMQTAQLEALQSVALSKDNNLAIEWLKAQHLNDKPRLAEYLQAEPGWERAVEIALGPYLDAVNVENLTELHASLENFEGDISLFSRQAGYQATEPNSLSHKVQSDWPIKNLLNHILTAANLSEALQMQSHLAAHQSVITKDGIWLGPNWLRMQKSNSSKSGVINRKQDLEKLKQKLHQCQTQLQQAEELLQQQENHLLTLENNRDHEQQSFRDISQEYNQANAAFSAKQAELEQIRKRETAMSQEMTECAENLQETEVQLAQARSAWQQALVESEESIKLRDNIQTERDSLRENLQNLRTRSTEAKTKSDELTIRLNSIRDKLHYLQENIARTEQQLAHLQNRKSDLKTHLSEAKAPLPALKQELEQGLAKRLDVEQELNVARENMNKIDHQIRELEHNRNQLEEMSNQVRSQLEQMRMEQRTLQVRSESHYEQINESGFTYDGLIQEMPDEANIDIWQENLTRLENRIQRLGAINLAAIEEREQLSVRKEYLDKQNEDLLEALQTLENAIHKIDRETRSRLRETYDNVNEFFKTIFPKIFGGGQASLEMTSDDVLNTGILVKAQPPGKRNTTIHLLSGGEKALTAIALIFSMFQLNPAPFCMLDEVDAPLDDANVGRFCNLIKEMSETVQFIFISHNKLTIETAKQLAGVTMNEPGVSRLVQVDIDEAIALAGK